MSTERVYLVVDEFVRRLHPDIGWRVPESADFTDLGLDSLSLVELFAKLEKEFRVVIPDETLPSLTTVGRLVEYVGSAGEGARR